MHDFPFSIFSEQEEPLQERWRNMRDRFFRPVCVLLSKVGVKPSHPTLLGLLMLVPFVYFFQTAPWLAALAIFLNVWVFDAIDGSLARYQHHETARGAFLDLVCDHAVFFGVMLTLVFYRTVDPFWASFYLLNYFSLLVFVIISRFLKVPVIPVLRSKLYVYLFFLIGLITGSNYLDVLLLFFGVYMAITNLFLFHRLRCSLP